MTYIASVTSTGRIKCGMLLANSRRGSTSTVLSALKVDRHTTSTSQLRRLHPHYRHHCLALYETWPSNVSLRVWTRSCLCRPPSHAKANDDLALLLEKSYAHAISPSEKIDLIRYLMKESDGSYKSKLRGHLEAGLLDAVRSIF